MSFDPIPLIVVAIGVAGCIITPIRGWALIAWVASALVAVAGVCWIVVGGLAS